MSSTFLVSNPHIALCLLKAKQLLKPFHGIPSIPNDTEFTTILKQISEKLQLQDEDDVITWLQNNCLSCRKKLENEVPVACKYNVYSICKECEPKHMEVIEEWTKDAKSPQTPEDLRICVVYEVIQRYKKEIVTCGHLDGHLFSLPCTTQCMAAQIPFVTNMTQCKDTINLLSQVMATELYAVASMTKTCSSKTCDMLNDLYKSAPQCRQAVLHAVSQPNWNPKDIVAKNIVQGLLYGKYRTIEEAFA